MKIGEEIFDDEGTKFVVKRTFSNEPYLERVQMMRDAEVGMTGDKRFVGSVPGHLVALWAKEAGVSFTDHAAVREIIKKKLMSGEYSKFRVWEGTW
jgi:hypothetical protein